MGLKLKRVRMEDSTVVGYEVVVEHKELGIVKYPADSLSTCDPCGRLDAACFALKVRNAELVLLCPQCLHDLRYALTFALGLP